MPANSILEMSSLSLSHPPDTYTAASYNGTAVAIQNFRKAEVILGTRLLGSSATLDVHVEYSTDDGSSFSDLLAEGGSANVAFAQLTDVSADENTTRRGLLYLTELGVASVTHLRLVAVVATAAVEFFTAIRLAEPYEAPVVRDNVAQASGGNAFYALHGVGAR